MSAYPKLVVAAFSLIMSVAQCLAAPSVTTSLQPGDVLLRMPRPEYPAEARKRFITGRGRYEVMFQPETGVVKRVTVLESTGSKILDDAAVKALSQWRARPGRLGRIRVPFTFAFAP